MRQKESEEQKGRASVPLLWSNPDPSGRVQGKQHLLGPGLGSGEASLEWGWGVGGLGHAPSHLGDGLHGVWPRNPRAADLLRRARHETFMCHLLTFSMDS